MPPGFCSTARSFSCGIEQSQATDLLDLLALTDAGKTASHGELAVCTIQKKEGKLKNIWWFPSYEQIITEFHELYYLYSNSRIIKNMFFFCLMKFLLIPFNQFPFHSASPGTPQHSHPFRTGLQFRGPRCTDHVRDCVGSVSGDWAEWAEPLQDGLESSIISLNMIGYL